MSTITRKQRHDLEERFGARVTFRATERKLYSHDMAALPGLFRSLIGRTIPDAVVQPESEEQLVEVVRWAAENRVPLTPRGKASSGYGGALPIRKGIVVDFKRLSRVVEIDPKAETATVQAGVVWAKLEEELTRQELALRVYPTSFPGSTVGGWLAQGGAGIGSFETGWFRDDVVRARAVLPDGTVREFGGRDLELVADAEGTTGLITTVTVRVQPRDEVEVIAVGCPDAHALQRLAQLLVAERVPIWSLVFINPLMAELKNRAPLRERHGQPVEERVLLPAAYITTLAFRARDREAVRSTLPRLLNPCEAELLSERIARHEWAHRSRLMVMKRLGPSLVPAEVVVPLRALGAVMAELERKVDQPIVEEGLVVRDGPSGEPEAVILGFIPSDERRLHYNLVFSLVLTVLKIAAKHGGRPYATGLYFATKANDVLGEDRVRRLKAFKAEVDPAGILNPGKVIGNGLLGLAMSVAGLLEPLIRPFGNYVTTQVGERPARATRNIPADVAWYAYSCSQCGYCAEACTQFRGCGWESQSPRGKWYWLREHMAGREEWDPFMVHALLACTTCEACNRVCSAVLPIESSWMKLRGKLVTEDGRPTFPLFEIMAASLRQEGNCWLGRRTDRAAWLPDDLADRHGPGRTAPIAYLTGCTACYVEPDICIGTARLLDAAGVDFACLGSLESCCGMPMLTAGKLDAFTDTLHKNIQAVRDAGADTVVTSCPACLMMWRQTYPEWAEKLGIDFGIQARHYTEVVAERLEAGALAFPPGAGEPIRVTWHDSCHMGRALGAFDPPRRLLEALPNVRLVELAHHRDDASCCGGVVTLIKDSAQAGELGRALLEEARDTGAAKLVSLCPCCQLQLRVAGASMEAPMPVGDLAHLAAEALGFDLPDPTPTVMQRWVAFEAARELLTPARVAATLADLWPELLRAMPPSMALSLRLAQGIPGGMRLLAPAFPALFRRMMPRVLPEIMPSLVARFAVQAPMPRHLGERLRAVMPTLLTALIPAMADDVARELARLLPARPRRG